jgi:hypothetical protein
MAGGRSREWNQFLDQRKEVMRRNRATLRSLNGSSEVSSSHFTGSPSFQLESEEDGCGSMPMTTTTTKTPLENGKSHSTNVIIKGSTRQQRPRRISRKKQGLLEMPFRLLSGVSHKPYLAKQFLVCVAATCLLLFWISLVVVAVMYEHLEDKSKGSGPGLQLILQNEIDSTSQGLKFGILQATKNAFFETKKITTHIPTFGVVFPRILNGVDHFGVAGTDELDPTDVLDGREPAWDLNIDFFEENGTVRQIIHDFEAQETHYRPPTTNRDDDVDLCVATVLSSVCPRENIQWFCRWCVRVQTPSRES